MKTPIFITGNQDKADYLARFLEHPVEYKPLDLPEIQSLDLAEVVTDKAKRAYDAFKKPVLVEDVSLEFTALGRLPGTFIKFFMEEIGLEGLCRMLDGQTRTAIARCAFAYYDGKDMTVIPGELKGEISDHPRGSGGFGWDQIFIPEGHDITRAEISAEDYPATYKTIKPFAKLKEFLDS